MKKLIFLFFSLFVVSCQNEYTNFHHQKDIQTQIEIEQTKFSFDQIEYLSGLILKETPDTKLLDDIVAKINDAQKRVYVEVYIFTEKRMKKALIDAKKRGIEVRVVLEKNIYLAGNLNSKTFQEFQKNGIDVRYSNAKNYSLNHSKMMIIDDEVMLSTGNYSYSSFKYNREFFLFLSHSPLLPTFLDIFENDFVGTKKNIEHHNLILSPFSSRIKLEYLLKNAKKSIKIYAHNFSDRSILDILYQKQKENVSVQMVLPDLKKVASNKNEVEELLKNKIEVNLRDKPEMHAKSILIDDEFLYIGSINFSPSSFDENREIGLLIKNPDIIAKVKELFKADFVK